MSNVHGDKSRKIVNVFDIADPSSIQDMCHNNEPSKWPSLPGVSCSL